MRARSSTRSAARDTGSAYTASFRWSLADAPWIDAADVEAAREQLPPEVFAAEYLGEFVDADAAWRVIDRADIEAAHARSLDPGVDPTNFGCLGVDVGHGGDLSVVVHLRNGHARVVFAERTPDLTVLIGRVAMLARDTGAAVAVDATGMGAGVHDALVSRNIASSEFMAARRAVRADRYLNARAEVWFAVRHALRSGTLDLDPADKALAGQLQAQRYRLAGDGRIALEDKATIRGGSPDCGDALAVAAWGARQTAAWSSWQAAKRAALARGDRPRVHPLVAGAEGRQPWDTGGLADDLLDRLT
jgi:hypothetical protein